MFDGPGLTQKTETELQAQAQFLQSQGGSISSIPEGIFSFIHDWLSPFHSLNFIFNFHLSQACYHALDFREQRIFLELEQII